MWTIEDLNVKISVNKHYSETEQPDCVNSKFIISYLMKNKLYTFEHM